ncbi:MAG: hypothetical protein ACO1Q7_11055 [Gemmatimonas sp.]
MKLRLMKVKNRDELCDESLEEYREVAVQARATRLQLPVEAAFTWQVVRLVTAPRPPSRESQRA